MAKTPLHLASKLSVAVAVVYIHKSPVDREAPVVVVDPSTRAQDLVEPVPRARDLQVETVLDQDLETSPQPVVVVVPEARVRAFTTSFTAEVMVVRERYQTSLESITTSAVVVEVVHITGQLKRHAVVSVVSVVAAREA